MKTAIKMKGFEKLQRKLDRLPRRGGRNAIRKATRAATSALLKVVRAATPKDEGVLRRAQASKIITRGNSATGIVGADVAKLEADERRPSNIDWLVEEGHVTPGGTFVPPSGHMRRAAATGLPQAEVIYRQRLAQEIEKEAAKA